MTWNEIIDRLKEYAKDNPALLDQPAYIDFYGEAELDNLEFYRSEESPDINLSETQYIVATP